MTKAGKIASGVGIALLVLAIANLVFIWWIGAWHILFPSHAHDASPPEIAGDFGQGRETSILVFSKTNSFRHTDGIPGAKALFEEIAERRGWSLFQTENGAVFNDEQLALFDVVIFSNASGDMLSSAQEAAFIEWLASGGGWIGLHAAGDGSHQEWSWYQDTLIGPLFTAHVMGPQTQEARVVVEDRNHPSVAGLPDEFIHAEEWYSWEESARKHGFHIIMTVDESTYSPWARMFGSETDLRMQDHPVVWSRCVRQGRALYSTMGHWAAAYEQPVYARFLENAVAWAAGLSDDGCVDTAETS